MSSSGLGQRPFTAWCLSSRGFESHREYQIIAESPNGRAAGFDPAEYSNAHVGSSPTSVAISISPRSPIGRGNGLRFRPVSVRI